MDGTPNPTRMDGAAQMLYDDYTTKGKLYTQVFPKKETKRRRMSFFLVLPLPLALLASENGILIFLFFLYGKRMPPEC